MLLLLAFSSAESVLVIFDGAATTEVTGEERAPAGRTQLNTPERYSPYQYLILPWLRMIVPDDGRKFSISWAPG